MKAGLFACALVLASTSALAHVGDDDHVLGILVQLFYPLNDAHGYESLDKIKHNDRQAYNDLMNIKSNIMLTLWWKTFLYDADKIINEVITNKISEFVENTAYDAAFSKTYNITIARRVGRKIKQELLDTYNSYVELPRGIYKAFIGKNLRKKSLHYANLINDVYNNSTQKPINSYNSVTTTSSEPSESKIRVYSPKGEVRLHPSEDCCICFDELNNDNRIYLPTNGKIRYTKVYDDYYGECFIAEYNTCGHDMCKACARSNFFNYSNSTCPQCRAAIFKTLLRRVLNK